MGMEKKRSKGSFLSLFDWNAKSRKKLTWNTPTLPEVSKQGKENADTMPDSQFNRIKVDENGASPINVASFDFNSTMSTCSDEGCGSKAPGLVARLMGLDSLPTSEVSELSCTSLYSSNSHGASHCYGGSLHSMDDFRHVDYINTPLKPEKSSWDARESGAHKMDNRPIQRFQTEMLPPKSAKPIPVTHNKLLSPIRSPGFTLPRNAAHVMEAAAKIIDRSPQPYMRTRMQSVGPSSVPLRILDLKERLEAAQYASMPEKLVGTGYANPANGKPSERSCDLHKCTSAFRGGSRDLEKNSSCHSASKGKSVSLAMQAKTNVQSKDTLVANGNRKYVKQKEQNEIKLNQLTRSQKPITHRATHQGTATSRNTNVLKQNNQKQNSMPTKGKSTSKTDSNKPTIRASSSESSTGIRKATIKSALNANIQPKRSSSRATDNYKDFPPSKTQSTSQKKYISRGVHEVRSPDNATNNFESKSIKCNFTTDGSIDQDAFNMNESNDVISFTFTSPLRRTMPDSLSSTEQQMETRTGLGIGSLRHSDNLQPKKLSLSPPGLHMIDGDALSVLLEEKLHELTSRLNLPQCSLASEEPSTGLRSSLQDKAPHMVNTTTKERHQSSPPDLFSDKLNIMHDYDDPVVNANQQLQTSEVWEDARCSSNSESGNDLGCQHSNAVEVFQTRSVSDCYLDSEDSTYGSTVYSSMQDEEVSNFSLISESVSLENEMECSEQSSFASVPCNLAVKQISGISNVVDVNRSSDMELEYVQNIVGNAEFMVEEFLTGRTNAVIMPSLFDLLENQSTGTAYYGEGYSKLERKVLFDYVNECLELRCRQASVGSRKAWPGWETSIQRNWLAEELYKEMVCFRNMEEVMVDELVSKDMSTGCGRWLDFNIEAFEEGLAVEEDILASLINELVSDLVLV